MNEAVRIVLLGRSRHVVWLEPKWATGVASPRPTPTHACIYTGSILTPPLCGTAAGVLRHNPIS